MGLFESSHESLREPFSSSDFRHDVTFSCRLATLWVCKLTLPDSAIPIPRVPMTLRTSVSLFVPSLSCGGAELVAINLSNALSDRGYQVDLVLQNAVGPFLSKVAPSVHVVDLAAADIFSKYSRLTQYLHRAQPTVLLSILDNINLAGWARQRARVPTRIIVGLHVVLSQHSTGLKGLLRRFLIRHTYRWADEIVAVSHGVAMDLVHIAGLPLERITIIPNPVTTPALLERAQEPVHHPWFAPNSPPVILGVGRLAKEKDFHTLIRAFALVRQSHPLKLILLGDGEERAELEWLIESLSLQEEVALLGFVDNPYPYMSQAAVFVLSSKTEAFGNVIVEALAVGTPVVATHCTSGPPEILEQGKYGRLVSAGNVTELAQAILATLKDPGNPERLRQRAQDFAVEPIVRQYLKLFQLPVGDD